MRVLYVTHYSIMEPLGQAQILPYLRSLAARGHSLEIISFEKPELLSDHGRFASQNESLRNSGIGWSPRSYRRGESIRNLLTDIFRASGDISSRCQRDRIDLLHCRAHVPFLMAWHASARRRTPILFDFRGFLAEEYVDARLWKSNSIRFRVTKLLERRMVSWCSAMIVLTPPTRDYIRDVYRIPAEKLFVIPCCVDMQQFHPQEPFTPRPPGRPLKVVYSGSTGGRYNLSAMLRFFSLVLERRPGSRLTILSTGDLTRVQTLLASSGLPLDTVSLKSLPHHQVAESLSGQDLGLLFCHGDLGLLASSPTKIGEYLACGLAVVAEKGLGGLEEVLEGEGVGCLVKSDSPGLWGGALDAALRLCDQPECGLRSTRTAEKYFSLERGGETYAEAYEYIARSSGTRVRRL